MSFANACFLFEVGVKLTVKGLVIPPEDKQKANRDTFQISFALFSSTSVGEFPLIASSSLCITTREGKACWTSHDSPQVGSNSRVRMH